MADVKRGDRVKLGTFTAKVLYVDHVGYLDLALENAGSQDCASIHKSHVEILKPLVEVGDEINPETLLATDWKVGSVLSEDIGPWHYINTGHKRWYSAEERETVDVKDMAGTDGSFRYTVIHIPDATP